MNDFKYIKISKIRPGAVYATRYVITNILHPNGVITDSHETHYIAVVAGGNLIKEFINNIESPEAKYLESIFRCWCKFPDSDQLTGIYPSITNHIYHPGRE